jgi:hypothetical protein
LKNDLPKLIKCFLIPDLSHCNPCVPVAETADLSKIADALATGVHRVLVIDHEGTLKNVITQSAIVVRFLHPSTVTLICKIFSTFTLVGVLVEKQIPFYRYLGKVVV